MSGHGDESFRTLNMKKTRLEGLNQNSKPSVSISHALVVAETIESQMYTISQEWKPITEQDDNFSGLICQIASTTRSKDIRLK